MGEHILTAENLCKRYGDKMVLDGLTFSLTKGVYGLIGANGAGKTTLMRLLCDIQRPTSGRVLYDRRPVSELGEDYRAILGYLPQQFGCYPAMTPTSFLQYMASLKGIDKAEADVLIPLVLSDVGLSEVKKKRIGTFSGGMKRRVGIAQALLGNPEVLILDEPTAGLDPKERVRFREMIGALGKERIVLLSTHIVSDVESVATNVLFMQDGKFIYSGHIPDSFATLEEMYMFYFGEEGRG